MHFNPDNKEYVYYNKKRENNKAKSESVLCLPTLSLFIFINLVCGMCLSIGAKQQHLYQDKHMVKCHLSS